MIKYMHTYFWGIVNFKWSNIAYMLAAAKIPSGSDKGYFSKFMDPHLKSTGKDEN
jgi:hypothetical protein